CVPRVIERSVGDVDRGIDGRIEEDIVFCVAEQNAVIEDPITGTDRGLSILERIPCNAEARSKILDVFVGNLVAEGRVLAGKNKAIEGIEVRGSRTGSRIGVDGAGSGDARRLVRIVGPRIKVPKLVAGVGRLTKI